ncbi:component of transporter [Carnobacterium funditum]|uniref:component of transporter n=1 Tax=Carnobacterium funditum TaxID=2752 RepID=UPI00068B8625|nr:component of transporter [Carnobacterium funditum]
MKTDVFPLTYFKNIWTPRLIFKKRHQLNWFQLLLVLFFLTSILMVPVSLNFLKMETYPIEESYPDTFKLMDESVVVAFQQATSKKGALVTDPGLHLAKKNGVVSITESDSVIKEDLKAENALIFSENEFYLKNKDVPVSTIRYTKDFTPSQIKSVEDMKAAISRQWFFQNRTYVIGSLLLLVFSILFVSTILIVLGSAVFLYLTKKNSFSSIKTYKESVNLILNALGLPSLIALISSFIQFDIIVMLTIQSIGLALMILMVFYTTRFNDKVPVKNNIEVAGGKKHD